MNQESLAFSDGSVNFALIVIVGLLWTGKINETTFNQFLEGFWRSIPIFKGQEPKTNNDDTSQETPESEQ
jgi:hypothetical protein